MIDFIIDLVESKNDFGNIGYIVLAYFGILWFLFSAWVFFDAKKRYERPALAAMFFVLVLVLNFPMLVFYLIIRPENDESYYIGHEHSNSALNIPIANFVNENGIAMSLNMKINHELLNQDLIDSDVKVDFSLKSDNITFTQPEIKEEEKEEEKKEEKKPNFFKTKIADFKSKQQTRREERNKRKEEKQKEKEEKKNKENEKKDESVENKDNSTESNTTAEVNSESVVPTETTIQSEAASSSESENKTE